MYNFYEVNMFLYHKQSVPNRNRKSPGVAEKFLSVLHLSTHILALWIAEKTAPGERSISIDVTQ